ncbi:MAG: methyltransferase domain-containing protein [Actinobacteria bacterium]|nr:methyltransferase domain-containing protein [Actinomycetota bacterium]
MAVASSAHVGEHDRVCERDGKEKGTGTLTGNLCGVLWAGNAACCVLRLDAPAGGPSLCGSCHRYRIDPTTRLERKGRVDPCRPGVPASASTPRTLPAKAPDATASFRRADAHKLPFEDGVFDIVVAECTTVLPDKERAFSAFIRVTKLGASVGDLEMTWQKPPPRELVDKVCFARGASPAS